MEVYNWSYIYEMRWMEIRLETSVPVESIGGRNVYGKLNIK